MLEKKDRYVMVNLYDVPEGLRVEKRVLWPVLTSEVVDHVGFTEAEKMRAKSKESRSRRRNAYIIFYKSWWSQCNYRLCRNIGWLSCGKLKRLFITAGELIVNHIEK